MADATVVALRRIEQKLDLVLKHLSILGGSMATIDDILIATAAQTSEIESLQTFLAGLKQMLADAIAANDPVKMQAALDAIDANTNAVHAAIIANTPAAPPIA